MTDRSDLREELVSEGERYRRLGQQRRLTEEELDRIFDCEAAIGIGYIDDDLPIPDRIPARLAVPLITGQVTACPEERLGPRTPRQEPGVGGAGAVHLRTWQRRGTGGLARSVADRQFVVARVGDLRERDVAIWPTATFVDGVPDPFNHIHFDVVAAVGADLVPPVLRSENRGNKRERCEARQQLAALIDPVLALFTDERQVP